MTTHPHLGRGTCLFLVVLALGLAACGSLEQDIDQLCLLATEIEKDSSVPAKDKVPSMMNRFDPKTDDGKNLAGGIYVSAPTQRYALVQNVARSQCGNPAWACEPMQRLWKEAELLRCQDPRAVGCSRDQNSESTASKPVEDAQAKANREADEAYRAAGFSDRSVCEKLGDDMVALSNLNGNLLGQAWGQSMQEKKLGKKVELMASDLEAEMSGQQEKLLPRITPFLGNIMDVAGCPRDPKQKGPAKLFKLAPAQKCKRIDQELAALTKQTNAMLDQAWRSVMTQHKLKGQIPDVAKRMKKKIPTLRKTRAYELQKLTQAIQSAAGCIPAPAKKPPAKATKGAKKAKK